MHVCTKGEYLHSLTIPGYTESVFNELETGCVPFTAAYEWLINQTALLSSATLSLLTFLSLLHPEPALYSQFHFMCEILEIVTPALLRFHNYTDLTEELLQL